MAKKKSRSNKKMEKKIEKKIEKSLENCCKNWGNSCNGKGGCFYFLGFLGAVVYYISTAAGFWAGVLGFLKALVWPAFLVHALLKFLGM